MCRARWLIGAMAVVCSTPLIAQEFDVERYREAMEQLELRYADLTERADQLDALLAIEQTRVNVEVGNFIIDTPIEYADLVRGAAAEADRRLHESIGPAADRLPTLTLAFGVTTRTMLGNPRMFGPIQITPPAPLVVYSVVVSGEGFVRVSWATREREQIDDVLTDRLTSRSYETLRAMLPPEFVAWTGSVVQPDPSYEFRTTYRELASSPFDVTRACRLDNTACLTALGLTEGADLWDTWYPGADLVTRAHFAVRLPSGEVDRSWFNRYSDARRSEIEACADGDRISCHDYLSDRAASPPIESERQGVLEVAFRMAGDNPVERMIDATGSTRERLEFIAGAPIDAILTEWRNLAFGSVGRPLTVPFRTGLVAVVWIAAFAGMSLGSTRWR